MSFVKLNLVLKTDRQTDRQTDGPTNLSIEATCRRLKTFTPKAFKAPRISNRKEYKL